MEFQSPASLETIYREYRSGLFSLALSIVGCPLGAEDAVHEAFVSLCRKPLNAQELVPYVFAAVRNAALDQVRRKARQVKLTDSLFNGVYIEDRTESSSPSSVAMSREDENRLRNRIDQLPSEQKQVIVLKAFAGLTFEQIGKVLEIPPKTAATRYRRLLKKLEEELEEES